MGTGPSKASATAPDESASDASSKLSVCLASPIFYPEYSGGATRFRRYAPGLDARGIQLDVLAASVGSWKPYRRFAERSAKRAGLPEEAVDERVRRVPLPVGNPHWQDQSIMRNAAMWRNKWIFESAVLARCRDSETRPDLLIWRYPLAPTSVRALTVLRRMELPMMRVVTIFGGPGGTGWKRWLKQRLFQVPFRFLDCVVVSSGVMRDNLRNLGVETRIEVIPHGVDLNRFHPLSSGPSAAPVREQLGLDPDHELVLFVGPLRERKGVDLLAQAWDRVAADRPRAHLVLVGPEPTGTPFADQVRADVASGRGADRVTFVGPVPDVEEYMRAADLFVFPSRREGMPNVVLEAFASGVPSILTPFAGLSDDLGHPGEQFLLVDRDSTRLAEAMCKLLRDSESRGAIAEAALHWAREYLDLEKSLDRLAEVCRDLVQSKGPSRTPRTIQ